MKIKWLIPVVLFLSAILTGCGGETVSPVPEKFYPIREGKSYGYINAEGDKVISPQYAYTVTFNEGLGGVNIGGSGYHKDMPENGKWGFINKENRIVINPKYDSPPVYAAPFELNALSLALHEAYLFSEGLAAVCVGKEWMYINHKDSVVISGLEIKSARRFSEGLAAVYIGGKWGYIDRNGIIAIKPQFLFPANFHQGHAYVMDEKGETFCIDRTGKRILNQYRVVSNFKEGFAPVKGGYRGEKFELKENLKMSLVDSTGYLTTSPQFDIVGEFGNGLAPVLVGSEQTALLTLKDDYRTLKFTGGKWGFINSKGIFVINPQFEDAKGFDFQMAPVKQNGLWGYLSPGGEWIYDPQFQWAGSFDAQGVAKVILSEKHRPYQGKTAYINKNKVIWTEP
ncbi:MAG: WG repeat-containing protein [Bacteroidia bacterium]|nr:WG repeat-containing protein [Bacteroidia bacterium]